tara:strand:- start:485 stop:940 length:456 start_codon:yes stop_codon:yes gene_type:complete
MNSYFKIIDDLKTALINEPFINNVSSGDIYEVDLKKITIFPLAHIIVDNISIETNVINMSLSLLLMDIVDFSKEASTDQIRGNNNEMDVINNMMNVAARLQALLQRSTTYRETYELASAFTCAPFQERFENNLAGLSVDFTINMENSMTSC